MKKSFLFLLAAAATLFSCSQIKEMAAPDNLREIIFRTNVGTYQMKATDTSFEEGDEVAIFAGAPINSGVVKYSVRNGVLSSATPICWAENQQAASEFFVVYPYDEKVSPELESYTFCVNADQSDHSKYTKSDLIVGYGEGKPSDGAVELEANHVLSKIRILVNNVSTKTIADVYLSGVYGEVQLLNNERGDMIPVGSKGSIKACPATDATGKPVWTLIIVPQTSQPELIITTTAGEQITYTLPSEVTFKRGKMSTAYVTLSENNVFTEFTPEIEDWSPDNDLQFRNGEDPSLQDWTFVGKGSVLDDFLPTLTGIPESVLECDVYVDKNRPGRYLFKSPYVEWCRKNGCECNPDAGIIINYGDSGRCYIEKGSSTGVIIPSFGEVEIFSDVEENGFGGSSYLSVYSNTPGNFIADDYVYLCVGTDIYVSYGHSDGSFTLPGYDRYPVSARIYDLYFSRESNKIIVLTGPDFSRFGVAVYPFASTTITDDLAKGVISSEGANHIFYTSSNKNEALALTLDPELSTGAYYVVAAGDYTHTDGGYYWRYMYQRFGYVAKGDVAPKCEPYLWGAGPGESSPGTSLEFMFKCKEFEDGYFVAVPTADFSAIPEADRLAYIKANGSWIIGSFANIEGAGAKQIVSGLAHNTRYTIAVAAINIFGEESYVTVEAETASDLSFVSIGKGRFYDAFSTSYLAGVNEVYVSEVEILQESTGKPIYRIMNPYKALWDSNPTFTPSGARCAESEYIQFVAKKYNAGTFVFFEPFYSGVAHFDDLLGDGVTVHPLRYTHGSGDVYDEPEKYRYTYKNIQLAEGVFQFAPLIEVGKTGYIYGCYDNDGLFRVELPGYSYEETKSSLPVRRSFELTKERPSR